MSGVGRASGFAGVGAPLGYGSARAELAELQRARIVSAMLDVCGERGAGGVSVAHVVERSGVSRRTFYELFTDREDCLLAAFEQALSYVRDRVVPAYRAERSWRDRVRAALTAFLLFVDEEPVAGRALLVESFVGGPRVLARRNEVIASLTSVIEEGATRGKAFAPASLTAEGVVGGVLTVIQGRLGETGGPLIGLTNPLMSMIVLPYLGVTAARRELDRVLPERSSGHVERTLLTDPFKEAGMRLTYRTVRVLMAVAEHPGASNRLVGDTADIKDQGQISKLLTRLQRAGMLTNTGLGAGTGAPNAWTLTRSGRQVTDSVHAHTQPHNHRAPQQ